MKPHDATGHETALSEVFQCFTEAFSSHPGFKVSSNGIEVLHADWPAYPLDHGLRAALTVLGDYPGGTHFFSADHIDGCTLLSVGKAVPRSRLPKQGLYCAVWDEDLRVCSQKGFLEDVEYSDESVLLPSGSATLTGLGQQAALVVELTNAYSHPLPAKIEDHLLCGRFDTAVRESSVLVEMRLREASGLDLRGRQLINACFKKGGVLASQRLLNSTRVHIRNAFSSYFAYVRNDYAHNLGDPTALTACRLVGRASALLGIIAAAVPAATAPGG